ncbi:MAG TPA: DUF72 domain-containing protein [Candidatus Acidoferrales bacterium]|nr:DUF72 domain-containing protein [Candidatus Acidoferrales bacterium]
MSRIYAGTSGWAYPTWKPKFYPAEVSSARFLEYYSSRLNSVEVNYTFRHLPDKKLLAKWIASAPPDFRFAVKAHQAITHWRRLRRAKGDTRDFLGSLKPLRKAGKLGPILFQLPPNFKINLKLLDDFLSCLPRDLRFAFEFRHESWFAEDVFRALRSSNIALCQAESEKLRTPDVPTADFSYLRLRKMEYSRSARLALAEKTATLQRRGDVYIYFKHEDDPSGAVYAEELLAKLKVKRRD